MKERILLVFDKGLGYGGVESVIMSIVRNLNKFYTFDLLTNTSLDKAHDKEFLSYGGKILKIPFYEGNCRFRQQIDYYIRGTYLYIKALKVIKKNMPYKAVHCNNSTEGGIVLKAAKKSGIPMRIMHSHAVFVPDTGIRGIITEYYRKLIMKNANCLIGCSECAMGLFKKNENCITVFNAYNENKFRYDEKNSSNPKKLKLIQIGRYDRIKNQEFSLCVLKEIIKVFPNSTLYLVGSKGTIEDDFLKNKANELNVLNNVFFCKADSNIPYLLNESSVCLFPSLMEGFGISLIETQAMGVKCYSSDSVTKITNCGGVEYIPLSDGPELWAKKIIADYVNGKCLKKYYDCSRFSQKRIMHIYKDLYGGKNENRSYNFS